MFRYSGPVCRIEKIDRLRKSAVIHFAGICSPVTLRFDEIVRDVVLIANLSPQHAAWIGYYYGLYHPLFITNSRVSSRYLDFPQTVRYKIISLDRKGNVALLDTQTQLISSMPPKMILNNRDLMMHLHSEQTCYIGILAGIAAYKNKIPSLRKPEYLQKLKLVGKNKHESL